MRRHASHAIVVLLSVLAAGLPSRAQEKSDLARPFAVRAGGAPIDVRLDKDGVIEHDNAYLCLGDFDGDGKPDLLIGQHTYPAGIEKNKGAGGRLRIYKNIGAKGAPRFGAPIWFDDRVPSARIHGG
ncbi:MAG TPA: FG-GAP repeat protein [Gemmataceae bacterium]|nr:FG-GAP repeat protein [Gemmataceae bacterium]